MYGFIGIEYYVIILAIIIVMLSQALSISVASNNFYHAVANAILVLRVSW